MTGRIIERRGAAVAGAGSGADDVVGADADDVVGATEVDAVVAVLAVSRAVSVVGGGGAVTAGAVVEDDDVIGAGIVVVTGGGGAWVVVATGTGTGMGAGAGEVCFAGADARAMCVRFGATDLSRFTVSTRGVSTRCRVGAGRAASRCVSTRGVRDAALRVTGTRGALMPMRASLSAATRVRKVRDSAAG
jgi:hypothetical protein